MIGGGDGEECLVYVYITCYEGQQREEIFAVERDECLKRNETSENEGNA